MFSLLLEETILTVLLGVLAILNLVNLEEPRNDEGVIIEQSPNKARGTFDTPAYHSEFPPETPP